MEATASKGNSFALPFVDSDLRCKPVYCVVGKLINDKQINFEAIKSVLLFAWKLAHKVEISLLQPGVFVCNFSSLGDLENIVRLGPWNVRGSLIFFLLVGF